MDKGERQRDTHRRSRRFEAASDGSPSAAFNAASPGYRYTWGDHLLSLETPGSRLETSHGETGFAPSHHVRATQLRNGKAGRKRRQGQAGGKNGLAAFLTGRPCQNDTAQAPSHAPGNSPLSVGPLLNPFLFSTCDQEPVLGCSRRFRGTLLAPREIRANNPNVSNRQPCSPCEGCRFEDLSNGGVDNEAD